VNGRLDDRSKSIYLFCDTDFIGTDGQNGGKFKTAEQLADTINGFWPDSEENKFVVFTGGEPALQLDSDLITQMHNKGFTCAVESNGTLPLPDTLDWVCISPKGSSEIVISECDELKLVFPQNDALPERFSSIHAKYRYLSPKNDWNDQTIVPTQNKATQECIEYCLKHPNWRLTLQSHKIINID